MFSRLSIKMRFMIIVTALISGFAMFGVWTFFAMKTLNVNGPVYQRIVQGKDLIADILPPPEYIIESYLVSLQLNMASDRQEIDTLIQRFKVLKGEFDDRHQFWLGETLEPEIKSQFLDQSYVAALAFYREADEFFIPALTAGNEAHKKISLECRNAAAPCP
jgi:methyl-accepting chemotaxis protein